MSGREQAALVERLESLEREVLRLRRELAPREESLPGHSFPALELRSRELVYAIPVAPIREVLPVMYCERLPDVPEWILGAFAYGGIHVPVIDLGCRLGSEKKALAASDVVVVVENEPGRLIGLCTDGIGDLFTLDPAAVAARPSGIPQAPFIQGTVLRDQGEAIYLLSVAKVTHDCIVDSPAAVA